MKNVFQFLTAFILGFLIFGCETHHQHLYKKTIVKATCTEQGYTEFICECGDTYKENYTLKTEHIYTDWNIIKDASENEDGLKEHICECGDKQSEIILKLKHTHQYENGFCKCGEVHNCEYIDYKCECGKELKTFKVIYYIDEEKEESIIAENEILQKPIDSIKEKYTFDGWYLDAEYNDEYSSGDLITEDITLFAKFNYNFVKVIYPNLDKSLFPTTEVEIGSLYELPTAPSKEGFEYLGWFFDNKYNEKIEGNSFIVDGSKSEITIYPGYKEYVKIYDIVSEVVDEESIITNITNLTKNRKYSKIQETPKFVKYYGVIHYSDNYVKIIIKLKNEKNEQVEKFKITSDDLSLEVLVDGNFEKSTNGEFVLNNTSKNAKELVFYLKTTSIIDLIKINIIDVK